MTQTMQAEVECHSSYSYPQQPRAFSWQGERMTVTAVVAEWHTPEGRAFRVRAADGRVFRLAYYTTEDVWEISLDQTA